MASDEAPLRNHGPQPLAELMLAHGLTPTDLVTASTQQLSYKMVARALKGRRLTPRTMRKVMAALQRASGKEYLLQDAFTYAARPSDGGARGG